MFWRAAVLLGLVSLLGACGGKTYAPVSDRSVSAAAQPRPDSYLVRKGDTLYSIAFRYGMDYRELARRNGIGRDYSIYPGQRLSLKNSSAKPASSSIVRDASITAPKPVITSSRDARQKTPDPAKQPVRSSTRPVAQKPVSAPSARARPEPVKKQPKKLPSGPIQWQWPASGRVISTFKTKGSVNKGINIAGSRGTPVKAAAKGKVVYAGNGLLGYGNLVIIDHNQQFLSAYAHNSRVLVKENDMVDAGQKIAEMGSTGADRIMLHFEIRRDGNPINPLKYLPKR
ncbi:peptidoglycan DD-metalloendopeptidase family protein [Neptuniibacter halophilus]|uniref:peptidoglycan DD-metalloendopeptidase family protein n=1 Tax=Neptuniibacter halophilus TaxID=651666 RepID=UPI0025746317|nr:peptidoglycan DD-metalloendopeptidase family protein [Neptuniibacter halophilus]